MTSGDCVDDEQIISSVKQWLETLIVGMNLCPFAKRELVKERVRFVATASTTEEQLLMDLQAELELLNANPSIETTLLIHADVRSEEHTSELQSRPHLVCRLLLEKKKKQ